MVIVEYVTATLIVAVVIAVIATIMLTRWRRQSQRKQWPRDMVIIHQICRGAYAPSVSPFPIKLETFLRITRIPYKTNFTSEMSSKGKFPWITHNGVDIADSQFSIEYCKRQYGVDINRNLSGEQLAVARAFQILIEDHLYWAMCAEIFGGDVTTLYRLLPYGLIKRWCMARLLRVVIQIELWGHGMGRHSHEETRSKGRDDLKAISTLIGEKPFMMGSEPCELDCAAFGMLALCKYHMFDSAYQKWIEEDFPNLSAFVDRMKERFWPDWDDVITHEGKQQPKL